jgi:hypothetical protein
VERFNADLAGRPQLVRGNTQILFHGMGRLTAQGGGTNGWSLYAKDGKLKFCYNFLGLKLTFIEAAQPIPAEKHQVRHPFAFPKSNLEPIQKGNSSTQNDFQARGRARHTSSRLAGTNYLSSHLAGLK